MSIPFFDDNMIAKALDYSGVAAELNQAFTDLAIGGACIHSRQRSECDGTRLSTMGAIWTARGIAAVKVYPTVLGGFSFIVNLFDINSNQPLALLAGNELTRLRTAAQTLLIASKVVPKSAHKLALFGAGVQGRAQAQALCTHFHFDEIAVVDPDGDDAWCSRIALQTGSRVRLCSPEAAVTHADIVVTATRSSIPVFSGTWLKPNALVVAIGTSSPKGRELDDVTLERATRIIVEWKPQSLMEAGEIVLWAPSDPSERSKIVDFPQLYRGEVEWPTGQTGITVLKSVGTGLADAACAHLAYLRLAGKTVISGLTEKSV